jgi:hypothetical protein
VRRHCASLTAVTAALCGLAGFGAFAHAVLLVVVVASGLRVLDSVSEWVAGRTGAAAVVLAVAALAAVVAAAALDAPLLALGALLGLIRVEPVRQAATS